MEPTFQSIGAAADFPVGTRRLVQLGPRPVLVLHQPDGWFAFDDFCPHRAGPLSEGTLTPTTIECPWHASVFDLKTGKPLSGPARQSLVLRQVRVREGQVEVSN